MRKFLGNQLWRSRNWARAEPEKGARRVLSLFGDDGGQGPHHLRHRRSDRDEIRRDAGSVCSRWFLIGGVSFQKEAIERYFP